jgi:hypothetical protein
MVGAILALESPRRQVSPYMAEKTNGTQDPPAPPRCSQCQNGVNVRPVKTGPLFEGVEYWRCNACGTVWGTLHGKRIIPD